MIAITDVRVTTDGAQRILSGNVDGQEAWFRFPISLNVEPRGEPFLAYAIFMGMARAEDITFDETAPLSPHLLKTMDHIQALLKQWNPNFTRVKISAPAAKVPRLNPGVVSSFSGGVDSSYTLAQHADELTHLMTFNNFDYAGLPGTEHLYRDENEVTAAKFGKTYVRVETNSSDFREGHRIHWGYLHGPLLCLVAVALGFDRFYIPSSYTYRDLKPWGSHPVLDPLWRTETTQIIHDGAEFRRTEKVEAIAAVPGMLQQLQVCWKNATSNCGHCSKCARTTIILNILGVKGAPIPPGATKDLIVDLKMKTDLHAAYLWDLMDAARSRGQDDLAVILEERLIRYELKKSFKKLVWGYPKLLRLKVGRDRFDRFFGRKVNRRVRIEPIDPNAYI